MVEKLKIESFDSAEFSGSKKTYILTINPETITQTAKINYDLKQAFGTSSNDAAYKSSVPEEIRFDVLFDNTITHILNSTRKTAISDSDEGNIQNELDDFKAVIYEFKGESHRPRHLKLYWGDFIFKGQLTDLVVTFKSFSPDGKPLRATASVTFMAVEADKTREKRENKQSPDLTHIYTIKVGDTLPVIAEGIYDNPTYYIDVARFNGLDDFRCLNPGDRIILPPLEK